MAANPFHGGGEQDIPAPPSATVAPIVSGSAQPMLLVLRFAPHLWLAMQHPLMMTCIIVKGSVLVTSGQLGSSGATALDAQSFVPIARGS